jgi:hypothetical protein
LLSFFGFGEKPKSEEFFINELKKKDKLISDMEKEIQQLRKELKR